MAMYGSIYLYIFVQAVILGITESAAPVWSDPLNGATLSVDESASTGVSVVALSATGGDGSLTYSVTPTGPFVVVGTELQTNAATDHEGTNSYSATLSVNDGFNAAVDITVTINIADVNDNAPDITFATTTVDVLEGTAVDQTVATFTIADADATAGFQNPTDITITGDDSPNKFKVTWSYPNGQLLTTDTPTSYAAMPSYTIILTATDAAGPGTSDSITVTIVTKPVITSPTAVGTPSLDENSPDGTAVFPVVASDADGDTLTYTITSQPVGNLFEMAGNVVQTAAGTLASLDYEGGGDLTWDVIVEVSDSTYTTSIQTQTITLADVNEPPMFTSGAGPVVSPENVDIGYLIYTAAATDPDTGATLTYSITAGNTNTDFAIDPSGGQVTVANKPLDKATTPSYTLTIQVSDGTNSVTMSLTVNVNAAPTFTLAPLTPIDEGQAIGTNVYTVVTTDTESDTITYSLTPAVAGTFTMTGTDVLTGIMFDYESGTTSYGVTFTINDGVNADVTTTETFTIADVNDEPPVLTIDTATATLKEGSPTSTIIATITNADADVTPSFQIATYVITSGNTNSRFAVDANGQLTPADDLTDYGTTSVFNLIITGTDAAGSDTVSITINIETEPAFITITTTGTHPLGEHTVGGGAVFSAAATDEDNSPTTPLVYSLTQPGAEFEIDTGTGAVTVASGQTFDFETATTTTWDVVVSVTDGQYSVDTPTQTITLTDENDLPVFTSATTALTFATGAATGTSIYTAVASDEDTGDTLTYSISGGDPNTDFSIDGTSGLVTNLKVLDYTVTASYSLVLRVNDGTADVDMTLPITVQAPPVFSTPASGGSTQTVGENTAAGTTVYTLAATDPDGDAVTYSIVSQTPSDVVELADSVNLRVMAGVTFDFEAGTTSFAIVVKAADDSSFALETTETLTLSITDENDPPVVNPTSDTVVVVENQGALASIATVAATDEDTGDTLTYTITSGNDGGLFEVPGGTVNTLGSLYFTTPTHTLQITVSDGTASVIYTLTVNVDSIPAFTSATTFSLPEATPVSATEVFQVVATDADGDTLTYTFTNDANVPEFTMTSGGGVTVAAALDFETATSYTLNFEAADPQSNTAATVVTVTITDSNDLPPVFAPASYTADVPELVTTATDIATVVATDGDTSLDNNNVIRYTITAGNDAGLFSIVETTGVVSATNLNHANDATHTLTITATDRDGAATGSNTDTATLVVTVKTKPKFTTPASSGLTFSISEDQAINTAFYTLVAPDADADSGTVTYALASQTPAGPATFSVDGASGAVTIDAELDIDPASSVTSYTLSLTANDGTYTTATDLVISITYVNDNPPIFTGAPYAVTVQETLAVGSSVSDAPVATDLDATTAHNTITYSITGGNTDSKFVMASSPANQVNLAAALDYSTTPSYTLTITASDGTNSATADLVVTVKTLPSFTAPASGSNTATIDENSATDTSVYQLVATDADGDAVTYSIVSQSTAGQFKLNDPTLGEVRVDAATLDYETNPGPFTVTFKATSDGAEVTSVALSISVNDVNDNAPAFTSSNLAKTLKTSDAIGTTVYQLAATDADGSMANNQISSYAIESGHTDSKFTVSGTGLVTTSATLGSTATTYTLEVIAVDSGTTALTGTVTIAISVVAETDPVLTTPTAATAISIPESTAVDTTIFTVVATDADGDTLQYTINTVTPSSGSSLFAVDISSGDLKVASTLNYEAIPTQTSFDITFYVDDDDANTANKLTSAVLTVTITDVNDYPAFTAARFDAAVMELHMTATSVIHQTATNDETSQTLTYSIVAGDPLNEFTIDSSTGLVTTTTAGLATNQQLYYLLAVQAMDDGTPPRAASYHVLVTVLKYSAAGRVVLSSTLAAIVFVMYVIL